MDSLPDPLPTAVWALAIVMRAVVARRTRGTVLSAWLAICVFAEMCMFGLNWYRWPTWQAYHLVWMSCTLIEVAGLVLVTTATVKECLTIQTAGLSAGCTAVVLTAIHHAPVWPQYWLEPVFACVAAVNCWCAFMLVVNWAAGITLKRFWAALEPGHRGVLWSWCVLNVALYAGAAVAVRSVGMAGEILNCVALIGIFLLPKP